MPFLFGKDEYGIVVCIESDHGFEILPLLALEAFQQGSVPVREQGGDFRIAQVTACFLTKDGQTTIGIVANPVDI